MELELRQETVRGWETVCRTTLEQEETAEAIVPDARPSWASFLWRSRRAC